MACVTENMKDRYNSANLFYEALKYNPQESNWFKSSKDQNEEFTKILNFSKLENDILKNVLNDDNDENELEENSSANHNSIFKCFNPYLKVYMETSTCQSTSNQTKSIRDFERQNQSSVSIEEPLNYSSLLLRNNFKDNLAKRSEEDQLLQPPPPPITIPLLKSIFGSKTRKLGGLYGNVTQQSSDVFTEPSEKCLNEEFPAVLPNMKSSNVKETSKRRKRNSKKTFAQIVAR